MESESRSNERQTHANDDVTMKDEARRELTALLESGQIHAQQVKTLTGLLLLESESMDVEMESANPTRVRSDSSSPKDAIVGLEFTNGRTMYCHRSTLVNAGGYFSACFGGNGIPAVPVSVDERGRNIYFVEGDGELFADYILPFILRRIPDELPAFSDDPKLWRRLRSEALFYVIDDLSELLKVTHSCPYIKGKDKGVLHWLGTGKGNHEYRNPYSIGAVDVTVGGLQDATYEQRSELFDNLEGVDVDPRAYTKESREALVHYRPPIIGYKEDTKLYYYGSLQPCYSLYHQLSLHQFPTVIDLVTIKLRLTAYSLRQDKHGMTDWNLEASEDGESWTALHKARNDRNITNMGVELKHKWERDLRRCKTVDEKVAITVEFAERERRHTWEVSPVSNVFYRFFRIIGSGSDYERHEDSSPCLHGLGLELYGDVHED